MEKGFTFVEIMVAVVIIGILSAIGVPRLFGAIAKSKATEVTVAVSEWDKLETAFIGDKKDAGTWKEIGFIPPGKESEGAYLSSNFKYKEDAVQNKSSRQLGISVYNTVALNACEPSEKFSHWQFMVIAPENENPYIIQPMTGNESACLALTPTLKEKYPGSTRR